MDLTIKKETVTNSENIKNDIKQDVENKTKSVDVKISVRNIVEFILCSGDIDNAGGRYDPDAMQEGSRLHRKIQKSQGHGYTAEVSLAVTVPIERDGILFNICVDGRADGIINLDEADEVIIDTSMFNVEQVTLSGLPFNENIIDIRVDTEASIDVDAEADIDTKTEIETEINTKTDINTKTGINTETDTNVETDMNEQTTPKFFVDEIKCVYLELSSIKEIVPIHRHQVMCYAYIYAKENNLKNIGIQLTYCNLETEDTIKIQEVYNFRYLSEWFSRLINEYSRWVSWHYRWKLERNASIKALSFPFEYRPGQKDLVSGVYRTILREKKIFIEAPTGVGKTISTVYPAIKSMGESLTEKIFYLTAKTITRTVAENTFSILAEKGLRLKAVTITAKEKICPLEKMECNPIACERAKGHYDRVNDAVYDMLVHEESISRDLISEYAMKHCVCPYEMCLDVTTWADAVICDYNYVFDPSVYLRRFFNNDKKQDFVFLIDEAHNLVDRAREMYSAVLHKQSFTSAEKIINGKSSKLTRHLEICNQDLLDMKRECDDCEIWESVSGFVQHLLRLVSEFDEFFQFNQSIEGSDELFQLYMDVRYFIFIHELLDENYLIYSDYDDTGGFRLKLMCMDPSKNIKNCLNKGKSAVFFSATLLPVQYYKEQLGGDEGDYAVYAPSPFSTDKRLLMVGRDVSTKYSRRSSAEYEKIVSYIETFVNAKVGNYFVFFPSYQMMQEIAAAADGRVEGMVLQSANMTEREREEFLLAFETEPEKNHVAFGVMGGIFSEGIDLKNDRLIGAVIVGTGLPMVCNERELFRGFYDLRNNCGFDYAYLYPGMNKVLQSAGRVIRTSEDVGSILLLDDRFLNSQYQNLFPREWYPYETVVLKTVEDKLKSFWDKKHIQNDMLV